jgi:hypothetical protein
VLVVGARPRNIDAFHNSCCPGGLFGPRKRPVRLEAGVAKTPVGSAPPCSDSSSLRPSPAPHLLLINIFNGDKQQLNRTTFRTKGLHTVSTFLPNSIEAMDSDAVKKAIIHQVLVESNTNNSRQLFEACFNSDPSAAMALRLHNSNTQNRGQTSTASISACQSPGRVCPAARQPVLRSAWRSTSTRGTRSTRPSFRGYKRSPAPTSRHNKVDAAPLFHTTMA